jgi:hypothetical protein
MKCFRAGRAGQACGWRRLLEDDRRLPQPDLRRCDAVRCGWSFLHVSSSVHPYSIARPISGYNRHAHTTWRQGPGRIAYPRPFVASRILPAGGGGGGGLRPDTHAGAISARSGEALTVLNDADGSWLLVRRATPAPVAAAERAKQQLVGPTALLELASHGGPEMRSDGCLLREQDNLLLPCSLRADCAEGSGWHPTAAAVAEGRAAVVRCARPPARRAGSRAPASLATPVHAPCAVLSQPLRSAAGSASFSWHCTRTPARRPPAGSAPCRAPGCAR